MSRKANLLLALGLGISAPLAAQQNDDRAAEVRRRNDCRLAGQVLTTGHPHPHYQWARTKIINCEGEGPAYFAAQWAAAPSDTATLRHLIFGSTRLRDARVYMQLRQTAQNRNAPEATRVAAMIALARYVDPSIAIDLSELRAPAEPTTRIRFYGGGHVDVVQTHGAQRLGSVTAEVLALLNRIAADRYTEDRNVWYAAAVLVRRIELDAGARVN
jgi:hypothetical protein